MTTEKNPLENRGFTWPEIIFAMAFAFFMMGTMFGTLDNGGLLREICYVTSASFVVIGILFKFASRKSMEVKEKPNDAKATHVLIVLSLLLFAVLFGVIAFVHDRQANPPEDFCQNIGNDGSAGSSLSRAVVLNTGQCIRNETGFHANGKAIFP